MNPVGTFVNRTYVPTTSAIDTAMATGRNRSVCRNVHAYEANTISNIRSVARNSDPWVVFWGGLRNRLHSIGVSVTDTTPDTRMAAAMVTANSCISRPTSPPMKSTGMNTATSDSVIDMIVTHSFEPSNPLHRRLAKFPVPDEFSSSRWRRIPRTHGERSALATNCPG